MIPDLKSTATSETMVPRGTMRGTMGGTIVGVTFDDGSSVTFAASTARHHQSNSRFLYCHTCGIVVGKKRR